MNVVARVEIFGVGGMNERNGLAQKARRREEESNRAIAGWGGGLEISGSDEFSRASERDSTGNGGR